MNLADFLPGRTDRALFVGQTGSGKTTLARALLRFRPYVLVYDGKGTLRWKDYKLITSLDALYDADPKKHNRIIYRPPVEEAADEDALEAFFGFAYARRNTTLYVDETYSVVIQGRPMPFSFRACLTRGRERGVETWCASQRAHWVPLEVMSEAEHTYVFKLKMKNDRDRLAALTGLDSERIRKLDKHEFFYDSQDNEVSGPYRLALNKPANS